MLSAPNALFKPTWFMPRRDMVKKTYENAKARGDENVYFIDGSTIFGEDWYLCTVDGCHPNDLGHYRMAMGILPVLEKLL
jgi:lysophospholipase L1-like esterase